jgi:predicted DNA-binding protein YlxM (UPF0122 family)
MILKHGNHVFIMKTTLWTEREKRVIELRKEGKTIREIATELKMSSRNVLEILKRAEEIRSQEEADKRMQEEKGFHQSIYTKALKLLKDGKNPLDVTIELGVKAEETKKVYVDFLDIKTLGEFGGVYEDIKDSLLPLLALHESMKKKGLGVQDAIVALEYASNRKKAEEGLRAVADAVVSLVSDKSLLERKKISYNMNMAQPRNL